MNCHKVSHLLSAYMDGELLGYEHRQINHHLQRCAACREEYEELLQMKRLLAGLRVREPGKALAASILQRVEEQKNTEPPAGLFGAWWFPRGDRGRSFGYSPVIGVGVGLTVVGLLMTMHTQNSAANATAQQHRIEWEPANVARDEPPPHIGELTNGLTRESAPMSVSWEPSHWDNLPDPPLIHRRASRHSPETFSAPSPRWTLLP